MGKKLKHLFEITKWLFLIIFSLCLVGCGGISDGEYTASVVMTGGSGKAYIESPCKVTVTDGQATAHLVWSSPNYDYMIVDGDTYYPVNKEGNSEFDIPVTLGKEMKVQADTTAMSTPHLIEYTLLITLDDSASDETMDSYSESADGTDSDSQIIKTSMDPPNIEGLTYIETDKNAYATCFKIHRYEDGYLVISIDDGRHYLLIPEGKDIPDDISADISMGSSDSQERIIPLYMPLDRIYLAASGAMCHFDSIGAVSAITMSGIEADDWYIDSAREAMNNGSIVYGGKYSAPDYEQIVMSDIDLAIENTMILHVPKVQEKLEQLMIPVFIDRSSYEEDPLGRCEWIKVYGAMTGLEDEARLCFDKQVRSVESLDLDNINGKKVAIFSINSNHQIVTRSSEDYFAKMVEMAGGTYLGPESDMNSTSQMTISIEAFYEYALDADILIYNQAIEDAPSSLEQLIKTDATFADFKAVSTGDVWCTDKSIYQSSDKIGTIIENLYAIIMDQKEETDFFYMLK